LGRYRVGTITLDLAVARSRPENPFQDGVGFTGYFRCRKCDAGGPWELPRATLAMVTVMAAAQACETEDLPFVLGCLATFDGRTFRYATEAEAHLKCLIGDEPERAFLWVRLGNLYAHADQHELAEPAYQRAIELDPNDIEAHSMLGHVLVETGRPLEAVPNWHAVLKHARHARQVNKELRRSIVRGAVEALLEAYELSDGQIELFPKADPAELNPDGRVEDAVIELREFDLSREEGMEELCEVFLQPPRRDGRGWFGRRRERVPDFAEPWSAAPVGCETAAVGRNDRCPCGSGRKYKKCCARAPSRRCVG
jgi:tetratricopeptide (TPR) repeat protein